MTKLLVEEQITSYSRNGFVSPIPIFDSKEVEAYIERSQQTSPDPPGLRVGQKIYLLRTWAADLARHSRLLDAVEDILGPNILCWGMREFYKEPKTDTYVSWHQDSAYWGFQEPSTVCTAWIALSCVSERNGCLKMIRGSHLLGELPHRDTCEPMNLLTRGQEVSVAVDRDNVVPLLLEAGEVALHHINTIHSSDANRSDRSRLGIAIRYVAPEAKRLGKTRDSALLLRGEDRSGYFYHEKPPVSDLDSAALAEHAKSLDLRLDIDRASRRSKAAAAGT
jgi:non-heme Fe2+,alpha-ketoglutarate-dependent halogenase